MRKIALWSVAALMLAAAWFCWPRPQPVKPQKPLEAKTWEAQVPSLKLVSPDGKTQWFLTARIIEFSEDGTSATVEELRAELDAEGEQLAVQAPQAFINWQTQDLEFTGSVRVVGREISINAQTVKWQAKTKQLQAEGDVVITTSSSKLEGQSLLWQQPAGKLVVEGGVKLWATQNDAR